MDIDLDTLKQEILAYLDASSFAVFRSYPGGLEGMSLICWDCERFPDYRMFLEAAQKLHVQLILVATREFEQSEIDVRHCDLPVFYDVKPVTSTISQLPRRRRQAERREMRRCQRECAKSAVPVPAARIRRVPRRCGAPQDGDGSAPQ